MSKRFCTRCAMRSAMPFEDYCIYCAKELTLARFGIVDPSHTPTNKFSNKPCKRCKTLYPLARQSVCEDCKRKEYEADLRAEQLCADERKEEERKIEEMPLPQWLLDRLNDLEERLTDLENRR